MKIKIAILLSIAILACGCGKNNTEIMSETTSSVTSTVSADETEVTTKAAESETVTATAETTEAETVIEETSVSEEISEITASVESETTADTTVTTLAATTVAATEAVTTTAAKKPVVSKGNFSMSTMEIVNDMGIGINLGNTYESCGDWIAQWGGGTVESYETAWGSPVITKKIIKGYADEGFGVLRIPVAWSNLMSDDYTISKEYMAAVREVVDWAIEYDLYVIINLHYDNGWMEKFPTEKDECMKKYTKIWEQVSKEFSGYGEKLIFESQNEELGWSSVWNPYGGTEGKAESFALVNEINQKFVDVVRSSGGNNNKRHLLISGYNTNIGHCCDSLFKMPDDPAGRCALSVHYYDPPTFAILTEDADWGKASKTWGTDSEKNYLKSQMKMLKTNFIDKGIPVIIGEYGCPTKNKDADSVRIFLSSVCKEACAVGACPVLWSVTGEHYNRESCKMYDEKLMDMLLEAIE